jgi:uncharacterized protein (DUF1501 family)
MPTRRQFLLQTGAVAGASLTLPHWLLAAEEAAAAAASPAAAPPEPVLVLLHLAGGNDSLNTVIPYTDPLYYRARPRLAIPREQVVALDPRVGLHPSLAPWAELFQRGQLAVLQSVGYPTPNRSHFVASDIWQTASLDLSVGTGWIARYNDTALRDRERLFKSVALGNRLPVVMRGGREAVPSLRDLDDFRFFPRETGQQRADDLQVFSTLHGTPNPALPRAAAIQAQTLSAYQSAESLRDTVGQYASPVTYPGGELARQLKLIAQMIASPLRVRTFHLAQGGYDTHANQAPQHARLLTDLALATTAFQLDLAAMGRERQVVLVIYSEFGRRVEENASGGTDHGGAGAVFVLGQPITGGLHGDPPALAPEQLDQGDLAWQTDFRQLYATLLDRWLGTPHAPILGASFPLLPLFG